MQQQKIYVKIVLAADHRQKKQTNKQKTPGNTVNIKQGSVVLGHHK